MSSKSTAKQSSSKKITQNDLRKLMSAQKRKALETVKKIESPLAKYSESGVLSCRVCDSVVKSEAVWNVHINSKQHKENIARKKQPLITPTEPLPSPQPVPVRHIFKKPGARDESEEILPPPPKKLKGILKNAPPLPEGFFDDMVKPSAEVAGPQLTNGEENKPSETDDEPMEVGDEPVGDEPAEAEATTELPEGFFDNPVLDAKARNVEYKDPIQEEWERFQREIKEEAHVSAQIIHDDTEDATAQRQIEEIDEQLRKLSRVVELEQHLDKFKADSKLKPKEIKEEELSSGDEDNFGLEFDWRAKRYLC